MFKKKVLLEGWFPVEVDGDYSLTEEVQRAEAALKAVKQQYEEHPNS